MPLHPSWQDVALRLVITMVACAVIGSNRGARGHAAGLRTTILVGLAASVAMIQANLLLSVTGKTPDSFGVMDLMRLPLGILTGVGFIGGGAILKQGELVKGVTTAATLWTVTVIGLCFGGGQIGLGVAAAALSILTLWALKWVDLRIPRERRAAVAIRTADPAAARLELQALVAPYGCRAHFHKQIQEPDNSSTQVFFELRWSRPEILGPPVELLTKMERRFSVTLFDLELEF